MRTFITAILAAFVVATAGTAAASGGPDIRFEKLTIDSSDKASLQRGARTFVNYCLNCHSARFMRYSRLVDIGLTPEMIRDNLMFTTDKIGDTMTITLSMADGKAWFGAPPPDLSVEARVRGTEWLYNYFLGFYQDEASATGWNNLVFPNVGMPHALWKQGGINKLVKAEFPDEKAASAALAAAKGVAILGTTKDHKYTVETLAVAEPGTMSAEEYRRMVADLVNYLDWVAEPAKSLRMKIGVIVLIVLSILFVLVVLLKREYWKDVH